MTGDRGDDRSPSCRLVPFGGQSLAGGDYTITESLGQLVEIHDDVAQLLAEVPVDACEQVRGCCVVPGRFRPTTRTPS